MTETKRITEILTKNGMLVTVFMAVSNGKRARVFSLCGKTPSYDEHYTDKEMVAQFIQDYGPTLDCPFVDGPCYSDGSHGAGQKYLQVLIDEGTEALFKKLEAGL